MTQVERNRFQPEDDFNVFLADKRIDVIQGDGTVREVPWPEFFRATQAAIRARRSYYVEKGEFDTTHVRMGSACCCVADPEEYVARARREADEMEADLQQIVREARTEFNARQSTDLGSADLPKSDAS